MSACPRCGAPGERPPDVVRGRWCCGPCLAELSGAVQIHLPPEVDSDAAVARSSGTGGALALWADALETAAAQVRRLEERLRGTLPGDAELVARAVMGLSPVETARPQGGRRLLLTGLPPKTARALAEDPSLPIVLGPKVVSPEHLAKALEDEAVQRAVLRPFVDPDYALLRARSRGR